MNQISRCRSTLLSTVFQIWHYCDLQFLFYLIRKWSSQISMCCFSALLLPIVRRHLISTYILHVGQLDTHFLSWWMKSHSSLSIHYISQTTSKKKVASFYTYLIKLQYKLMPVNRVVRCVGLTLWYYVWKPLIHNIWFLGPIQ